MRFILFLYLLFNCVSREYNLKYMYYTFNYTFSVKYVYTYISDVKSNFTNHYAVLRNLTRFSQWRSDKWYRTLETNTSILSLTFDTSSSSLVSQKFVRRYFRRVTRKNWTRKRSYLSNPLNYKSLNQLLDVATTVTNTRLLDRRRRDDETSRK